ncbi:MAG TPA: HAD-IA family hydrolase [Rhodospirillaceae bacterium]|nr:HAD-IA family hydrolase [Rhodospirillaceae bacterium]
MIAKSRLAVFDVDGTLIDSQHAIVSAMQEACRDLGLEAPAPEAVRRIIGLSLVEAVARLMPDLAAEQHQAVAQAYKQCFLAERGAARPEPLFPGALEALRDLEQGGWLLGIATGKSHRGLESVIERTGLGGRFVTLQTADDHPGKPHPAMLLRAISEAGLTPGDAVMIGDTVFDMAMGRQAGSGCAGVAWGYHAPEELREAGAHVIVGRYDQLPSALASLFEDVECD